MQSIAFKFEIIHQSSRSRARVGRIHTPHGVIDTPNFVGVGTNGSMKAIDNLLVSQLDLQLMFCNTYHLMLQPGSAIVKAAGGLHRFIGRNKPIITDSGGFQVFSLAYGGITSEIKSKGNKTNAGSVLKITEDGVLFRSYRNGDKVLLTPESSIAAQKDLGADIIIPFDELPPYHISAKALRTSFDRTHRWELRSLRAHLANPNQQAMYAVIHGGVDEALRQESCGILTREPFDGYAIGGSLGKDRQELIDVVSKTVPHLPTEKPNHLLGIGDLETLEACIPLGIDTLDSSYPTKSARHGVLFTSTGPLKITRSIFSTDFDPIDSACSCYTCTHYSRGYLNHLFKAKEPTSLTLASIHNVAYMVKRMSELRTAILQDRL